MPAPAVINRLPLVSSLLKWFKGDELTIDNALFKLHHQVNLILVTLFLEQSQIQARDGEPTFYLIVQLFPGQHFYCNVRAFVHFSGKSPGRTRDYLPGRRQLCKVSKFDLDSGLEMRKGLIEGVGALAGGE